MSASPAQVVCAGCGTEVAASEALPFACPARVAGDDIDHVLGCSVDPGTEVLPADGEANPFLRYRRLMWVWHAARLRGLADRDYVELVESIDREIAAIDGHGFVVTPYRYSPGLQTFLKDETHNVAGSHKARHLMGIAIHLAVLEASGAAPWTSSPELAIASCGNAALAAAVVAKAARRPLRVFIPPSASPRIVARLRALGAALEVCERHPGDPPGDPCYRRFREAVAAGALPFSCQGSDNGLTIDGGRTLGFELAAQHAATAQGPLSHLFVQVGGGALASATFQAVEMAVAMGALPALPRLVAVQTEGGHPLHRAWRALRAGGGDLAAALEAARHHRSGFMWAWESEPKSVAEGILDDETYDWWQIARGLVKSGGESILATEDELERAFSLAAEDGIAASHTGAAGYAGLLAARARADFVVHRPAVLFTGVKQ